MTKTRKLPFAFLAASFVALALSACNLFGDDDSPEGFQASRWIRPDSLMAMTYYRMKFESGDMVSSRMELYVADLKPAGFENVRPIFGGEGMVPCGGLIYRPQDSLLVFSYLPLRKGKANSCNDRDLPRRIVAGKWGREPFAPAPAVLDTTALLAELEKNLSSDGESGANANYVCVGEIPNSRCVFKSDL